ncbi:MAG: metallophosphoesterase [Verrucomicrobiae bacterium]|nr:metallophosphoesterase [Verrucomicrobiae bacterium]
MVPVIPTPGNHEYYTLQGAAPNVRVWDILGRSNLVVTLHHTPMTNTVGVTNGFHLAVTAADGRTASAQLDADHRLVAVDAGFDALTGYAPADLLGRPLAAFPLHDRPAVPPRRVLAPHWRPQFTLPRNGPAGLEETVYYLDYQGTRIVSLNSNELQESQVGWLREILARNPNRWTLLTFHHPVFSPARNRDNPRLRALWKPVFDEFRVDLVLTGHDHTYARTGDVAGRAVVGTENVPEGYRQAWDPEIGTVYVVSVSGPKMYAQEHTDWAVRRAEDTQLFQVITVDGDELRYQARTATGRLYDAFTLRKRPGRPNALLESLPPEHRRPPATPAE